MEYTKQSCEDFINILASQSPTPGGGGASALVGALGVALGNMVGSLTLGKKKYASVQADILSLKAKADNLQDRLIALVAEDAEAFEPLARAYGMPKETDAQREEKACAMEAALIDACEAPLRIMRLSCEAIELHGEFAAKGTAIAISDVGVGVLFCKAALMGASLNVYINTKMMRDHAYAEKCNTEARALLDEFTAEADRIYSQILSRLEN